MLAKQNRLAFGLGTLALTAIPLSGCAERLRPDRHGSLSNLSRKHRKRLGQ
jgi:hypothetical protein